MVRMVDKGRLVGKKVERYRIMELIGKGSTGEVYKAHDVRLRRDVAIKAYEPSLLRKPGILERFVKEARIQARLEHANIVPIYDIIDQRRQLFIVLRLVTGENLRRRIERRRGPLDPPEAVGFYRQVCDAVGFAHSKGVIHQDLKPHNIQVTRAGEALVLDFGVARLVGERREENENRLVGTPAYMPPEQVEGRYTDARADIYALGMSLFQICTAHHPFEDATDVEQILRWHVEREPVPPSSFRPELPKHFVAAIMKAIEKDPRDRFRSCRDFIQALEHPEEQDEAAEEEQKDVRWDPRVELSLPARVHVVGTAAFFPARTTDLSAGGLALRMATPPPAGTDVAVELYLPGKGTQQVIRAEAMVMRVATGRDPDAAFVGLRFTKLADRDRAKISAVVREALVLGKEAPMLGEDTAPGAHIQ